MFNTVNKSRYYYSLLLTYLKNLIRHCKGWRVFFLIAYMWLVLMANALADVRYTRYYDYAVSLAVFILLGLMYICPKILSFAEKVSINPDIDELTRNDKRKFFMQSFCVSLVVFFIMYVVFYPGGFSPDSIDQYGQAAGFKNYKDWHPVLHTLFVFTLPLKISGGWVGSIVLFQIIIFSLALAYMALTLAELGNKKFAELMLLYIIINPATLNIVMYPWKDVMFAIFAMLSITFAARIHFTGGQWLNSPVKILLFVIIISACTIFRHNAILFTFPLLIIVMIYVNLTRKILLAAGFCAVILLVRGPLYEHLNVEKPGYRVTETTCLPMTIIGNAVLEKPDKLDRDIVEFAYKVAPAEQWRDQYVIGEFNSVKFRGINRDIIETTGYAKIIGMMLRCFVQAPSASIRSLCALTCMVYGIAGPVVWSFTPSVNSNPYQIANKNPLHLQFIFRFYSLMTRIFLKQISWHIGVLMLVVLIFFLAKFDFSRKSLYILPLFMYNFGTMLFLGGPDFRFFYVTYLVMPLILLVLLRDNSPEML